MQKKNHVFFLREKCKISGYKNVAKPCNQAVDIFLKKVNYKFYVVICELHSKVEQKYNFCKEKSKPELLMSYFFREKKLVTSTITAAFSLSRLFTMTLEKIIADRDLISEELTARKKIVAVTCAPSKHCSLDQKYTTEGRKNLRGKRTINSESSDNSLVSLSTNILSL